MNTTQISDDDLIASIKSSTPEVKSEMFKFLSFTPEQRAVAFAAVGLASKVVTTDSTKQP